MMTLEQKLQASRKAYHTLSVPELRELVTAMFTMLEIEDNVASDFHQLQSQVKDITTIMEYHYNAGIPLFAVNGKQLQEEEVGHIINDLEEIVRLS